MFHPGQIPLHLWTLETQKTSYLLFQNTVGEQAYIRHSQFKMEEFQREKGVTGPKQVEIQQGRSEAEILSLRISSMAQCSVVWAEWAAASLLSPQW